MLIFCHSQTAMSAPSSQINFSQAARMLRAVAHPARLAVIVELDKEKRLSVNDLSQRLKISQSMTSQHLAVLRNSGVVGSEKVANECFYFIANRNVLKLLDCLNNCCRG